MTNLNDLIAKRIDGSLAAIASLRAPPHAQHLAAIIDTIRERLARGGTIYTCGNGGSAAEALHLAEELIGRYRVDRPPLRAICLNADPTALTCISNDFGFEHVFSRQCQALLTDRDALVVFSTSGNSPNILLALHAAKTCHATTIGLLGREGGKAVSLCDQCLIAASVDSAHIQECHQVALHLICEALEASQGRK